MTGGSPLTLRAGDVLAATLLRDGRPLAGALVRALAPGAEAAREAETDAHGTASIPLEREGRLLLAAASVRRTEKADRARGEIWKKADWEVRRTTLELLVLPKAPPKAAPEEEPVPPEEQKEHEGAKRFARLLIQEIALYHPDEIEAGRTNKNLYSVLRDDIERSREAFEQRYQKPSIRKRDYFRKALVQYLADGDPTALGN